MKYNYGISPNVPEDIIDAFEIASDFLKMNFSSNEDDIFAGKNIFR